MFREMNRKDNMLSETQAKAILAEGEYGVLSMQGDYPYGIPLSYAYFNNAVYFHCALEGLKIELLKKCGKVCFTVASCVETIPDKITVRYKSAIVFGQASFSEGEEKMEALVELCKKYSPGYLDKNNEKITNCPLKTAVIKIAIDHISGKQSGL